MASHPGDTPPPPGGDPSGQSSGLRRLYGTQIQGVKTLAIWSTAVWLLALAAWLVGYQGLVPFVGISACVFLPLAISPPRLYLSRRIRSPRVFHVFSFVNQCLIILAFTGIIHFSGGLEAAFLLPIYCGLILFLGVVYSGVHALVYGALCAASFTGLVLLEHFGILDNHPVLPGLGFNLHLTLGNKMMICAVSAGVLMAVAGIAARASRALQASRDQVASYSRTLEQEVARQTAALRQSEQRHRMFMDRLPDPVVVYDMQGRVVYLNPAFGELLGHGLEELRGGRLDRAVRVADARDGSSLLDMSLAGEVLTAREARAAKSDGEEVAVSVSTSFFTDPASLEPGCIMLLRDMSETHNLQLQLLQSQKMEALGILAGGVAHDFNNIMQGILGYANLLRLEPGDRDRMDRGLGEIEGSVQRASGLVQSLLTFSRRTEPVMQPMDLNQAVRRSLAILERTLPKMIDIQATLEADPRPIMGDVNLLEQAVLNLAANARDAMPEGGRLAVETMNVDLDRAFQAAHPGASAGPHVSLTVSDDGVGMDAETLRHVFEPFFTTKEVGKGTGLGLSMVYGAVSDHGGVLTCRSRPGQGARFRIYLPALPPGQTGLAGPRPEPPAPEPPGGGAGQTVLLADDEAGLVDVMRDVLEAAGYRVLTAATGEKALELFSGQGGAGVVVLDLGMPGMGGKRCWQELRRLDPAVKVIVASGYTADRRVHADLEQEGATVLSKPFALDELVRVVGEVLDS